MDKKKNTTGADARNFDRNVMANLAMASMMPPEQMEKWFREQDSEKLLKPILGVLHTDISDITDRMTDEERKVFCNVLTLWLATCSEIPAACVFFTVLRNYLLPMAEKLTCLERSVQLLETAKQGEQKT